MSQDVDFVSQLAATLRAYGCCVLTARNLTEVADLIRLGIAKRFVLLRIEADIATPAELRAAMEEELPGWTIEAESAGDRLLARGHAAAAQPLN